MTQRRGLSALEAASFEEAEAAFGKGDLVTAQRLLAPLVDQG
jgi:hypothetical protein